MNTVVAIVAAMWILPIVGIVIAHLRLSRDVRRRLAMMAEDRACASDAEAIAAVRAALGIEEPVLAGRQDEPMLHRSRSGRVDVAALNERRLFAISQN